MVKITTKEEIQQVLVTHILVNFERARQRIPGGTVQDKEFLMEFCFPRDNTGFRDVQLSTKVTSQLEKSE